MSFSKPFARDFMLLLTPLSGDSGPLYSILPHFKDFRGHVQWDAALVVAVVVVGGILL